MSENWDAVAADVAEALGEFSLVTLTAPASGGTFDPATDTTTGAAGPATHAGSGVQDTYSAFSVASGVVAAGDVKFLLSPLKLDGSPMPEPVADSWTLAKSDGEWTVKAVEAIRPAGITALYELRLRKGPG